MSRLSQGSGSTFPRNALPMEAAFQEVDEDHDWDESGEQPRQVLWQRDWIPSNNTEVRMYTERIPVLHLPYDRNGAASQQAQPVYSPRPPKLQAREGTGGGTSSLLRPETSPSGYLGVKRPSRFWQAVNPTQAGDNIEHACGNWQEDDYDSRLKTLEKIRKQRDEELLKPPPPFIRYEDEAFWDDEFGDDEEGVGDLHKSQMTNMDGVEPEPVRGSLPSTPSSPMHSEVAHWHPQKKKHHS